MPDGNITNIYQIVILILLDIYKMTLMLMFQKDFWRFLPNLFSIKIESDIEKGIFLSILVIQIINSLTHGVH